MSKSVSHTTDATRSAATAPSQAAERGPAPNGQYADILALQRSVGNRAVGRLMQPLPPRVPSSVDAVLSSGSGQSLNADVQRTMEERFGHDFSGVQIHTNGQAANSARDLNAQAYTIGQHIVFDAGRYAPDTGSGKHLLAHELTHVVQQHRFGGSSRPLTVDSSNSIAEHEAASVAGTVTANRPAQVSQAMPATIQRAANGQDDGWFASRWHKAQKSLDEAQTDLTTTITAIKDKAVETKDMVVNAAQEKIEVVKQEAVQIGTDILNTATALKEQGVQAVVQVEHKVDSVKQQAVVLKDRAKAASSEYAAKAVKVAKTEVKQAIGDEVMEVMGTLKGVALEGMTLLDTVMWLERKIGNVKESALRAALKYIRKGVTIPYTDDQIVEVYKTISGTMTESESDLKKLEKLGLAKRDKAGNVDVSLAGAFSEWADKQAESAQKALGVEDKRGAVFTTYEAAELKGAIGAQVGLGAIGAEEVQLGLKAVGLIGAVKGVVQDVERNPNWKSDINFWAGILNIFLSLFGLNKAAAANKIIKGILKAGLFLNLIPPMVKLYQDYTNAELAQNPTEQKKELAKDWGGLAKSGKDVILHFVHNPPSQQAPEEGQAKPATATAETEPTAGSPVAQPAVNAEPPPTAARPVESPPTVTPGSETPAATRPNVATVPPGPHEAVPATPAPELPPVPAPAPTKKADVIPITRAKRAQLTADTESAAPTTPITEPAPAQAADVSPITSAKKSLPIPDTETMPPQDTDAIPRTFDKKSQPIPDTDLTASATPITEPAPTKTADVIPLSGTAKAANDNATPLTPSAEPAPTKTANVSPPSGTAKAANDNATPAKSSDGLPTKDADVIPITRAKKPQAPEVNEQVAAHVEEQILGGTGTDDAVVVKSGTASTSDATVATASGTKGPGGNLTVAPKPSGSTGVSAPAGPSPAAGKPVAAPSGGGGTPGKAAKPPGRVTPKADLTKKSIPQLKRIVLQPDEVGQAAGVELLKKYETMTPGKLRRLAGADEGAELPNQNEPRDLFAEREYARRTSDQTDIKKNTPQNVEVIDELRSRIDEERVRTGIEREDVLAEPGDVRAQAAPVNESEAAQQQKGQANKAPAEETPTEPTLEEKAAAARQEELDNKVKGGTLGASKTDIPGLHEDVEIGASPLARPEGEKAPTPGPVKAPTEDVRAQGHAEEELANKWIKKIDTAIETKQLNPSQLEGKTIWMHIEQDVCSVCRQGLKKPGEPPPKIDPGVLRQLSEKYPQITIEVTNRRSSEVLRIKDGFDITNQ